MAISTDSVKRLLDLLEPALRIEKVISWQMWSEVLDVPTSDPLDILPLFLDVVELHQLAVARMNGLPELDLGLYMEWEQPVKEVLDFRTFLGNWDIHRGQLTSTVMQSLKFSAHESLRHPQSEETLSEDLLGEVRTDIEHLQAKLVDAEIPPELKELLGAQLESARQALIAYQIRGAAAIERAFGRTIGSLVLHRDLIRESESEEVGLFNSLMARIHRLLAMGLKVKELAGPFIKLIGAGDEAGLEQ